MSDPKTQDRIRRHLAAAGVERGPVMEDLTDLCIRRGVKVGASDLEIAAVLSRVRLDVPGPFEPSSRGEAGARGGEVFRRRFPNAVVVDAAADVALRQRRERDAAQVRAALLAASNSGRAA